MVLDSKCDYLPIMILTHYEALGVLYSGLSPLTGYSCGNIMVWLSLGTDNRVYAGTNKTGFRFHPPRPPPYTDFWLYIQ